VRNGFPCPNCGGRSEVRDSRYTPYTAVHKGKNMIPSVPAIKRRRQCVRCFVKWTTWEVRMEPASKAVAVQLVRGGAINE